MTLTEFLLVRIAEDEAAIAEDDSRNYAMDSGWVDGFLARCERECEAKRRVLELMQQQPDVSDPLSYASITVRLLALPYADHDDYREEWRL